MGAEDIKSKSQPRTGFPTPRRSQTPKHFFIFGVVIVHLLARGVEHLERDDLEVALLEALDNLADKAFAYAVGLDDDKRFFFLGMHCALPYNALQ